MKRLSLALAALLAVGGAYADTITFEYGLPIAEVDTDFSQTGSLSLFNASQGTLTGVSLQVFGAATQSFVIFNPSTTASQSGRGVGGVDITFSSSLAAVTTLLNAGAVPQLSMSFSTGPNETYAPGQTRTFGPLLGNDTETFNANSILASFVGVGSFSLTCLAEGFGGTAGSGNLQTTVDTTAGCGAQITYTFDRGTPPPPQVPEPASLALVGLALAGASFASRRRRQA